MSAEWQKAKEIFNAALDLDGKNREIYLENACRDDNSLRHEVDSLLSSFKSASGFLNTSAVAEADDPSRAHVSGLKAGQSFGRARPASRRSHRHHRTRRRPHSRRHRHSSTSYSSSSVGYGTPAPSRGGAAAFSESGRSRAPRRGR